ncbi:unnamed protein product [Agarophyton chilense]
MLGLGTVFKALLLLVNSMAILHEERFLNKVGWSEQQAAIEGGVKLQIVNLLKAFRVLRRKLILLFCWNMRHTSYDYATGLTPFPLLILLAISTVPLSTHPDQHTKVPIIVVNSITVLVLMVVG